MSPLSDSKRSIVALALIFCSGGSFLFAQEQSATPASDQRDLFERAVAQAESTAAISHQLKDIFQRTAKAVVKIHGVDEHSEICGTGFFIDPTGTLYTAYTVGGKQEISQSNSAVKNIRRASFWQTSAAGQPC